MPAFSSSSKHPLRTMFSDAVAATARPAVPPRTASASVSATQLRIVSLSLHPQAVAPRPRYVLQEYNQPCPYYLTIPPKLLLLQPKAKRKMVCVVGSRKPKKLHE